MLRRRHLPLPQRKVITARLFFFSSAYRSLSLPILPKESKDLAYAEDHLRTLTAGELHNPQNQRPLHEFVRDTLTKLREEIEYRDLFERARPQLFSDLGTKAERLHCPACAHPENVCDNSFSDHNIVDSKGACILLLRNLFQALTGLALQYYLPVLRDLGDVTPPALLLHTSHTQESARSLASAPHIYAETTLADSIAGHSSFVDLRFRVSHFDSASYATIPYILFHEIFVHGFQQLLHPQRPPPSDLPDPFAEGWMDWLAFNILRNTLTSGQMSLSALTDLGRPPLLLNRWRRVQAERCDQFQSDSSMWLGATVAERLAQLLDPKIFLHLSLALNLLGLRPKVRHDLVYRLYDTLLDTRYSTTSLAILLQHLVESNEYRQIPFQVLQFTTSSKQLYAYH